MDINPDRLYPFAEARNLIPSCYAGRRLSLDTLHRWRERGLFKAEDRRVGGRRYWFVRGSELLRLLGTPPRRVRQRSDQELLEEARREIDRVRARARIRSNAES